ncbi:MAG: hypothetical protein S4CHLAM7_09160 [Chlamydiae bacterium]|nr:hypothetical protein [Chlamydiota bacterium]
MRAYTFHSFVSFIFILFGLLLGTFLCLAALDKASCESLVAYFQKDPQGHTLSKFFFISGVSLLSLNTLLFTLFYFFNKKSFYQVKLEKGLEISIALPILNQFLRQFFKEEVAESKVDFTLKVSKKNCEIIADFSNIPLKYHEQILDSIEPKLIDQFSKRFGLSQAVTLSVFCNQA